MLESLPMFYRNPRPSQAYCRRAYLALSIMDGDNPVRTVDIVRGVLGSDRRDEMGSKKSRHWCERLINALERNGLMRRLPTSLCCSGKGTANILWALTPLGHAWLRRYDFNGLLDSNGATGPLPPADGGLTTRGNQPRSNEMASAKKTCAAKCAKTDKACKADKCAKTAKKVDIGEIKDKVTDVAGKIPQWIARAKKELEALIERLNKLDAYLAKILDIFGGEVTWANVRRVRGTRSERNLVTLLMKQRQAMVAYKEALEARIAAAEKGEALKVNP